MTTLDSITTKTLEIWFEISGPETGRPVILMHGWPYGAGDYDQVVRILTGAGCRTIVPHLRGFGPTRFLAEDTPRSGQQAALADDLKGLMDALRIRDAVLVGYDWGGRACSCVAALWPERVAGLVVGNGYTIQDIGRAGNPATPEQEARYWYQFYFQLARGRAGLKANRRELCRLLWRQWSPHWAFDEQTFERAAAGWDNPDFVDVTVHSYRHRYGNAAGDPAYDELEEALAAQPVIGVPTIVLHGEANGVTPPMSERQAAKFTRLVRRGQIARVGHNLPAEAPREVAEAVFALLALPPAAPVSS